MYKKKYIIVAELSNNSGLGHWHRMQGLKNYLKKKNVNTQFFLFNEFYKKIDSLKNKIQNSIILFDLKYYNKNYIKIFKKISCKVINFENFQNKKYDLCIGIYNHDKKRIKNRKFGIQYAMIRNQIFNKIKKYKNKKRTICVSLGSTETKSKLLKIINKLHNVSSDYKIFIITDLIKEIKINNIYVKSRINFLNYFIKSEILIVNAGVTILEAIFLKKKVIAIPQSKNEKFFLKFLKKLDNNIQLEGAKFTSKRFNRIKNSNEKKIIDGLGYSRIFSEIKKLISSDA